MEEKEIELLKIIVKIRKLSLKAMEVEPSFKITWEWQNKGGVGWGLKGVFIEDPHELGVSSDTPLIFGSTM